MAKPGPKPLPTATKVARGNPGRRPLPKNEPMPTPGRPTAPSWLGKVGRQYWTEALRFLPDGLVTKADGHLLSLYASAWEEFHAARELVEKEGRLATSEKGAVYQHPAVGMMNKARAEIRKCAALFGLSPADRVGLSCPADEEPKGDTLMDMLRARSAN